MQLRWWGVVIHLATALVGVAFPAYKSIEALETQTYMDDSQWLCYWLISAFITMIDRFTFHQLNKIWLFPEAKLALLVWLALPPFNGAALLYKLVRPHMRKGFDVVKDNVDTITGQEPADGTLATLRNRIAVVKTSFSKSLQSLYDSVSKGTVEKTVLEDKIADFETMLSEGKMPGVAQVGDSAHGMDAM